MTALETLCQRKSNGETLSMAEFAVWVLYSTARYSTTDAAKKTVEVAEQAAAELARQDAVIKAAGRLFVREHVDTRNYMMTYNALEDALTALKESEKE